jgi:hypothetical protein
MESGRLLRVLSEFVAEVAANNVQSALAGLVAAFQASVNSPSNPNLDQQFRTALDALNGHLENCPSNGWPPSMQAILAQTGLASATGRGLRERVHRVFTEDFASRSSALAKLNEIAADVQKKITEATQAVQNLSALGAKVPAPSADEAEVAFVLPNSIDVSNLELIQRELKIIDQLLRTISELTGDGGGSARVEEISKGSFVVVVLASLPTALVLLKVVDGILGIWQRVIDLKLKLKELEQLQVPQSTLDDLQGHIDGRLTQGVQTLAKEIVGESKTVEEGRRNELEIKLRISAKQLAARIDTGATVEVSVLIEKSNSGEPEKDALRKDIATRGAALMRDTPRLEKPVLPISLDTDAGGE